VWWTGGGAPDAGKIVGAPWTTIVRADGPRPGLAFLWIVMVRVSVFTMGLVGIASDVTG
jgi:hypothetical protein